MDKAYEKLYHDVEEHNWWFVARRDALAKLLKQYAVGSAASILDIGSAGGALLLDLQALGYTSLYALDRSREAIVRCRARGLQNAFVGDGLSPACPEEAFDVVIASDSLEHLEADQEALANWRHVLKPSGVAFIFVPAFRFLWSEHDDVNQHYRRYSRKELVTKATAAGFRVLDSGYWNSLLFLPVAAVRLWARAGWGRTKRREARAQVFQGASAINAMLIAVLKLENSLGRRMHFPVGVSTYVVLAKEGAE